MIFSIIALLVPMAFTGFTALSVLNPTTTRTPAARAAAQTFCAPKMLV